MSDLPFEQLSELLQLEKIIRQKGKLEWGDPEVRRYFTVRSQVAQYMPREEEKFFTFLDNLRHEYQQRLEGEVDAVREEFQSKLDEAYRRLEAIAQAVKPYLTHQTPLPQDPTQPQVKVIKLPS